MAVTNASPKSPSRFRLNANPTIYSETGFRSFFIDETAILRGADKNGQNADENDPPIKK